MDCKSDHCDYVFLPQEQTNLCCPKCGQIVKSNMDFLDLDEKMAAYVNIRKYQSYRDKYYSVNTFLVILYFTVEIVFLVLEIDVYLGADTHVGINLQKRMIASSLLLILFQLFFFFPSFFYPKKCLWFLHSAKGKILGGILYAIFLLWVVFFFAPWNYKDMCRMASQFGMPDRYADVLQSKFYIEQVIVSIGVLWLNANDWYAHAFCRKISKYTH